MRKIEEKIKVEVEIDPSEYEWLSKLAKKMRTDVGEVLSIELREHFVELDVWRHRFDLLDMHASPINPNKTVNIED